MKRRNRPLPVMVLILALPGLIHALLPKGDPFKPFSLVGIDGITYTVTLQDGRLTLLTEQDGLSSATHPALILIDFWATWCVPCRAAMPHMQRLSDSFQPAADQEEGGMVLLGIALDRRGSRIVKPFYRNLDYTYPMLVDPTKGEDDLVRSNLDMISAYGVQGIPLVYLIDSGGIIRHVHTGFKKSHITLIESEIRKILEKDHP